MPRRLCVLILSVVTIASGCADPSRAETSSCASAAARAFARMRRSTRHRSSSTRRDGRPQASRISRQMLKRAGHKPVIVTTESDVARPSSRASTTW